MNQLLSSVSFYMIHSGALSAPLMNQLPPSVSFNMTQFGMCSIGIAFEKEKIMDNQQNLIFKNVGYTFKSLIFLGFFLISFEVLAESQICEQLLSALSSNEEGQEAGVENDFADFWNSEKEIVVQDSLGSKQEITLSTDTEIPWRDVYKLFLSQPEKLEELQNLFDGLLQKPFILPLKSLAILMNVSEKQFPHFFLRRGVAKDQLGYQITDLSPIAFETVYMSYFLRDGTLEIPILGE
ncbi:MAG: hypothetical protein KDD34_05250, partial [Bdellovibrionales bacterium]|nr:hypothetical protein [Bdellovibrionales bacterium]